MSEHPQYDQLTSRIVTTEHLLSSKDDETILIGGDLIPDDNDMYPRNIGSREMPFRLVFADNFIGNVEPQDERGSIGYHNRPFNTVFAKTLKGNLEGTVNGMTFPGNIHGFGWLLLELTNKTGEPVLSVLRSSFPKSSYDQPTTRGTEAAIRIHPVSPALMFVTGREVYAEIHRFSCHNLGEDAVPTTTFRRLLPEKKGTDPSNAITLTFSLPNAISCHQTILVRLY